MCGVWEQFETISQLKDHNIDTQYKLGTACLGNNCPGGGGRVWALIKIVLMAV